MCTIVYVYTCNKNNSRKKKNGFTIFLKIIFLIWPNRKQLVVNICLILTWYPWRTLSYLVQSYSGEVMQSANRPSRSEGSVKQLLGTFWKLVYSHWTSSDSAGIKFQSFLIKMEGNQIGHDLVTSIAKWDSLHLTGRVDRNSKNYNQKKKSDLCGDVWINS